MAIAVPFGKTTVASIAGYEYTAAPVEGSQASMSELTVSGVPIVPSIATVTIISGFGEGNAGASKTRLT
jgi:hypothetical protein